MVYDVFYALAVKYNCDWQVIQHLAINMGMHPGTFRVYKKRFLDSEVATGSNFAFQRDHETIIREAEMHGFSRKPLMPIFNDLIINYGGDWDVIQRHASDVGISKSTFRVYKKRYLDSINVFSSDYRVENSNEADWTREECQDKIVPSDFELPSKMCDIDSTTTEIESKDSNIISETIASELNPLDTSLHEFVSNSDVSVRLGNCIDYAYKNGVLPFSTIYDYLSAGSSAIPKMLKLPNFGRKSAHELDDLVKQFSEDFKYEHLDEIESIENLTIAPQFVWNGVELTEDILNSSLLMVLNSRIASGRLKNCFEQNWQYENFPFKTIKDVLSDDGKKMRVMLRFENFGRKSANDLMEVINSYIDDETRTEDNSNFDTNCSKSLSDIIPNLLLILAEKELEIISLRYGLNGNTIHTLEAASVLFNVTRERIRQIEKKALNKLKLASYQKQVIEVLSRDGGNFFSILARDRSYVLTKDLYRTDLPGEYILAFDIIDSSTRDFLSKNAQKFGKGWLKSDIPLAELEDLQEKIRDALAGRKYPVPIETLDIDLVNYSHIPLVVSMPEGLSIYDGLIFDGRVGRRKIRQARLYRILLSGYQQLDSLAAEYNTLFPTEACSCRDCLIVMMLAPHLFFSLGDLGWAAIGNKSNEKYFAMEDECVEEDNGTDSEINPTYSGEVSSMADLIRQILTKNGPMHFVELRDEMLRASQNNFSRASLGPILIMNDDFVRVAPGVYGLKGQFGEIDLAKNYSNLLLKDLDCQMYILARRAGEKLFSYPMWTPLMEYKWCEWAFTEHRTHSTEFFSSLMHIANPYYWPIDQEKTDYWLEIKNKEESYTLQFPHKHMLTDYLPTFREVCAALTVIDGTSSMNWVRVNRLLSRRINDHHAASMMALLIGLGAINPGSSWQFPHSKGEHFQSVFELFVDALAHNENVSWSSSVSESFIQRLHLSLENNLLGWVDVGQYTAFIECLSSEYEINSPNAPTFSTIDETLSPMELLLSQLNRKNRENQFAEILEELNIC